MTRLLFFGRIRDVAGAHELQVDLPRDAATVADLCSWLGSTNSALGEALTAPGSRYAVDMRFADIGTRIEGASEIAFMSPLSGG